MIQMLLNLLLYISAFLMLIVFVTCVAIVFVRHDSLKKWMVLLVLLVFSTSAIYLGQNYLFTFDNLDRATAESPTLPITSPDNQFVAYAYYNTYGDATSEKEVWVEVQDLDTFARRVVYYSEAQKQFDISWVEGGQLHIFNETPGYTDSRRSTTLNVERDLYHDKGFACKSLILANEYESCYQAGEEQL